jgi:hypothetical protein
MKFDIYLAAIARRRAVKRLEHGDRVRVRRCGGIHRPYKFIGWHGFWMVSASGIDDLAPTSITAVNNQPWDPIRCRDFADEDDHFYGTGCVLLATSGVKWWAFSDLDVIAMVTPE